jgi:nitrite reductase/ring-hydroxylating ferredoxin subunit
MYKGGRLDVCLSNARCSGEWGGDGGGECANKTKNDTRAWPRPSPTYPRTHFPFFPPVPFSLYPQGGKAVVELAGKKLLVAKDGDTVYCSSNKCSHLGISLQGKTPLLQAEVKNGCVTCSAHGTVFRLSDGAVQGEWCPKLPNLPIVGKGPKEAPLPVYPARVSEAGMVEVDV